VPGGSAARTAPHVRRERPLGRDEVLVGAGVGDRRLDLGAVAHDAGVREQPVDLRGVEAGHDVGVEAGERLPERGRLRRMVSHDSPAWKPSRHSFSNSRRSSVVGTPHSSSW
jgi:hypothetical protein